MSPAWLKGLARVNFHLAFTYTVLNSGNHLLILKLSQGCFQVEAVGVEQFVVIPEDDIKEAKILLF